MQTPTEEEFEKSMRRWMKEISLRTHNHGRVEEVFDAIVRIQRQRGHSPPTR